MRIAPLLALTLATFSLGLGELMIAGILPDVARDAGVGVGAAGALIGVYALTFALASPPLAVVLTRSDRRTALIGALLVVALANAAAAGASAFGALLALRVVAALGSAVASTIALATVDGLATPATRGRAHGLVFAGFAAAASLGVPLGVVVADRWSWRFAFLAVAVAALAAAVLAALLVPRIARPAPIAARDLLALLRRPALLRTLAISLLALGATYVVFTYVRPLLAATGGFDAGATAAILFLYGTAGIVGNVAGGVAVDRIGTHRTLLVSLAATALVFCAFDVAARSFAGAAIATIAWSVVSWGFAPAVNRQLSDAAHAAPEIGLALNLTAFNAGIAAGSAAGAIVLAHAGATGLPWAGAAFAALAFALQRSAPPVRGDRRSSAGARASAG